MPYAILFDIDGTLVDADGAGRVAMEETLRRDFGVKAANADVSMAGRTDAAIIADVLSHNGVPPDAAANFRDAYVARLAAVLPERSSRVLPGAEAAVERAVADESIDVGLLTGNLRAAADLKLANHGLADRFDFGAYGDDYPDRNDVAGVAAGVLAGRGRFEPADVWVVGDTPADVACARSAGFSVAAVATGGATRDALAAARPDLLLDSLEQADRLFERLA